MNCGTTKNAGLCAQQGSNHAPAAGQVGLTVLRNLPSEKDLTRWTGDATHESYIDCWKCYESILTTGDMNAKDNCVVISQNPYITHVWRSPSTQHVFVRAGVLHRPSRVHLQEGRIRTMSKLVMPTSHIQLFTTRTDGQRHDRQHNRVFPPSRVPCEAYRWLGRENAL